MRRDGNFGQATNGSENRRIRAEARTGTRAVAGARARPDAERRRHALRNIARRFTQATNVSRRAVAGSDAAERLI